MIVAPVERPVGVPVFPDRKRVKVPCRSAFIKILCCIPTFGYLAQWVCESRLNRSVKKIIIGNPVFETKSKTEHLKVTNSILKCGIFRELSELALAIAGLALGVLLINAALPALIIEPIFIAIFEAKRAKNKRTIERMNDPLQSK